MSKFIRKLVVTVDVDASTTKEAAFIVCSSIAQAALERALADGEKLPLREDWILQLLQQHATPKEIEKFALAVGLRPPVQKGRAV